MLPQLLARLQQQPPAPPFHVEYYCPRQSPNWQRAKTPTNDYQTAVGWCYVVKPPQGSARVVDWYGRQVFIA